MSKDGEKERLISERLDKKAEREEAQLDKDQLDEAIKKAKLVENDFKSTSNAYESIEIQNTEWKGLTRIRSDKHREELNEAIRDYGEKYQEIIEQMEEDSKKKKSEIDGLTGEINALTRRIEAL